MMSSQGQGSKISALLTPRRAEVVFAAISEFLLARSIKPSRTTLVICPFVTSKSSLLRPYRVECRDSILTIHDKEGRGEEAGAADSWCGLCYPVSLSHG